MQEHEHMTGEDGYSRRFDELYTAYRAKFIRFAYSFLRDRMAAEDIVMDSFMHYWEHRESVREELSPPAYILTAVRNRCLNHLKAQQVRRKAHSDITDHHAKLLQTQINSLNACDPQEIFAEETRGLLLKAISSLPPLTREIFIRSRVGEESYREIIEGTGVNHRAVDYHLRKANKLLSRQLGDRMGDLLPLLIIFVLPEAAKTMELF